MVEIGLGSRERLPRGDDSIDNECQEDAPPFTAPRGKQASHHDEWHNLHVCKNRNVKACARRLINVCDIKRRNLGPRLLSPAKESLRLGPRISVPDPTI